MSSKYGNSPMGFKNIHKKFDEKWMDRMVYITKILKQKVQGDFELANFRVQVSSMPFVTMDFILKNPNFSDWSWYSLSSNPSITPREMFEHPEFPWSVEGISSNPNLRLEFVLENPQIDWDWSRLSSNEGITIDVILENRSMNWKWSFVSGRKDLSTKIVVENPDIPWKMHLFFVNGKISDEDIESHPEIDWRYRDLAHNENVSFICVMDGLVRQDPMCVYKTDRMIPFMHTVCYARKFKIDEILRFQEILGIDDISRDCDFLSNCKDITFQDVTRIGLRENWNWSSLSEVIDFKYIIQNTHLPWNFGRVIRNNPTLKWKDLPEFEDLWDTPDYILNSLDGEKEDFFLNMYREHMAAFRIQTYFRRAYWFPEYMICRKRLNREFDETCGKN